MSTRAKTVTVACPACKTVNPDAEVTSKCSACGEPLAAAVIQQSIDELKRLNERMAEISAPSFKTFNGFGTTLLDYRARDDGAWEATRWVVAAMLPVFPLASYVIRPRRQQNSYGRMESYFDILGRAPLTAAKVVRPYALVVVGLAPVVLGFMNSRRVDSTIKGALGPKLGGIVAMLAMLACIVWAAYIIFFKIKNDSEAYKQEESAKAS
jgi:hypothetical protein